MSNELVQKMENWIPRTSRGTRGFVNYSTTPQGARGFSTTIKQVSGFYMTANPNLEAVKSYLLNLQDRICQALVNEDSASAFKEDHWQRPQGGGGCTRVLEDGPVIEKCGVNFSHVWGEDLPATATTNRPELIGCHFQACGISVIVHPRNPYAPTVHFNLRFFIAEKKGQPIAWWFGGGFDLTPYYGFEEDCIHWQQTAKQACEAFGPEVYAQFKKNADEYFFIKHRNEPRGIGGIFFDDLNQWGFDSSFKFIQSIGEHFLPAYIPILARRKQQVYGQRQRDFQLYRRGRYVEFNLVYDRGTLFGLQWGGRMESILISLPPQVLWRYDWKPELGSEEAKLYQEFLRPRNWIGAQIENETKHDSCASHSASIFESTE